MKAFTCLVFTSGFETKFKVLDKLIGYFGDCKETLWHAQTFIKSQKKSGNSKDPFIKLCAKNLVLSLKYRRKKTDDSITRW